MKRKKLLKISIWTISLGIVAELVLRFGFGLGSRPLYEQNDYFEYCLQANQDLSRYHNTYVTNGYGMRSKSISKSDKKRVLLFGDSVLNGGSKVSQEDLASSLLDDQLNAELEIAVNMCNISAGSWGVENAFQFLKTKIDFDFNAIVLVFSSHDYHDNMHHRPVVGIEPAWPNENTYTAIGDVWDNYLVPKMKGWFGYGGYDYLEGFDDSAVNPGWINFIQYAKENEIPIIVYHHPEDYELKDKSWSENGQALQKLLIENSVQYIDGLDVEKQSSYIDNIHLNKDGHELMASAIKKELLKLNIWD
jgi:hypothetical protein